MKRPVSTSASGISNALKHLGISPKYTDQTEGFIATGKPGEVVRIDWSPCIDESDPASARTAGLARVKAALVPEGYLVGTEPGTGLLVVNGKQPRVEVLAVRDPDGDTTVSVWVDGQRVPTRQYDVDPGRGYDRSAWDEMREDVAAGASPAAAISIREAFEDYAENQFINQDE